ncbi:class-II fumarase/aspartase family protein [Thaumasiovibrio subtropicus]|uniref:class-II fumarase/aspartase family protein n=1 Tax=Thaumasiovibrio subtropicus TaxID=1891207 RepID=UPI000B361432|nr:adenylosuccinate lyase family protein [Thaumasiovibrio subtropicus]
MNPDNVSVFDSALYSPLFTQAEMKAVWSDKHLVSCWLQFETEIAAIQADLGIIPAQAAKAIQQAATIDNINWTRLAAETAKVGMAIKPMVDQISEAGDPLVKQYLHWGCTTQDLLDTAQAMRLKSSLSLIRRQVINLIRSLSTMADAHRNTVMVARTNSQDALPTTWGLQLASYLTEMTRNLQRLDALTPRATMGMYGGAVGNLSSIGRVGLEVRERLMSALGLTQPIGLWNASLDGIAETIQCFAIIHGSLCRIANDIELMGRAPLAEVREGEGGGGSSTMPHKANPRACNMIQTLSRMGWMYASSAPNLMDQQDVRAASMRVLNWSLVPESCLAVSTSLARAQRLLDNLIVNKDNMRRNFAASRNLIMSEAVMMQVAEQKGRGESYAMIKTIIHDGLASDMSLEEMLLNSEAVTAMFSEAEITALCDPRNYLGCNDALIDESLAYAQTLLEGTA